MFLLYYSKLSFLPMFIKEYLNYFYSICMLWIYQGYFEMLISEKCSGLLIKKNPDQAILYLHSGFYEVTTTINDLPLCFDLSYKTEWTIFSLEYTNNNIEDSVHELENAYLWLKKRYKNIIVIGSGFGCYLIQNWLSYCNMKKKINTIFLSPILSLKVKQSYFNYDILNYRNIRQIFDKILDIDTIDHNRICSNIERLMIITGRKDPFYNNAKKFMHFVKSNTKINLERHVLTNMGHVFFQKKTEKSNLALNKICNFINLSKN